MVLVLVSKQTLFAVSGSVTALRADVSVAVDSYMYLPIQHCCSTCPLQAIPAACTAAVLPHVVSRLLVHGYTKQAGHPGIILDVSIY